tara:strand:+ start:100 stop:528 length:429 start_codon:yes stop_codon:yes gene_type:complete
MWLYKNKEINSIEDMPADTFGFVYLVTHTPSGKKYLGKKQLIANRTLPPLKGQKKKRKIQKESDWKTYYGSQTEVKQLVKESQDMLDFVREIIIFTSTKKQLTYFETKLQFVNEVLENDEYLNSNILGKFFRKDLYDKPVIS